jgi:hypothetical protein
MLGILGWAGDSMEAESWEFAVQLAIQLNRQEPAFAHGRP